LLQFREFVSAHPLSAPRVPIISALGERFDAAYWTRHLREPVRFSEVLSRVMAERSDVVLLEIGPSASLSSLVRRHPARNGHAVVSASPHPDEAASSVKVALEAMGRLWTLGVAIDWTRFDEGRAHRRLRLPTYPFQRVRCWRDPEAQAAPSARVWTPSWT